EFFGLYCPLTPLGNELRHAAGQHGYEGGFIDHYLLPLIYPAGLTPQIQLWLGLVVLSINLAVYSLLLWRSPRQSLRRLACCGIAPVLTLADAAWWRRGPCLRWRQPRNPAIGGKPAMQNRMRVAGAGSGLGRGIALRWAREGWLLALADINGKGL